MAYHHKITLDELKQNLSDRILEDTAELKALRGVLINTSHKTLNNRSVTGAGVSIRDYININKALYVSYVIEYPDRRKYECTTIPAYSYIDEDGKEIGVNGCIRISRTITPLELRRVVDEIIAARVEGLKSLKRELKRSAAIVNKQNSLIDKIDAFNSGVSYASKAQI